MTTTLGDSSTLLFYVNGSRVCLSEVDPEWTLLFFLRKKLKLTGSKLGCAEGGCGACTVMVSRYDPCSNRVIHMSVNACLAPVCSLHHSAVTTVEGIGSTRSRLHAVQERLAKSHGSQCGFCTPGIVMSVYSMLRNRNTAPTMHDIETSLQGNLCRCTGYRPILDAFRAFCVDDSNEASSSSKQNRQPADCHSPTRNDSINKQSQAEIIKSGNLSCCRRKLSNSCCKSQVAQDSCNVAVYDDLGSKDNVSWYLTSGRSGSGCCMKSSCCSQLENAESSSEVQEEVDVQVQVGLEDETHVFQPYDPSQEPIFPPELKTISGEVAVSLEFHGPRVTWYRPSSLNELLKLKTKLPRAKIVNGNSEIGVETKSRGVVYPHLLCPSAVGEMTSFSWDQHGLTVGAAVTLTELHEILTEAMQNYPVYKTRVFAALLEMLHWFAGVQIRNTATIGGNIMTGSPISDLIPLFSAANSKLTLVSADQAGARSIPVRGFYTAYRRNTACDSEILLCVTVPFTTERQYFMGFKQSLRREDDISIVNAGMMVEMQPASSSIHPALNDTSVVQVLNLCYGGVAATCLHPNITEQAAVGRCWDKEWMSDAVDCLLSELQLDPGAPGGMISYRTTLIVSLFFKFYQQVLRWLHQECDNNSCCSDITNVDSTSCTTKHSQLFQMVPASQISSDLVGRPVTHMSAVKQTTGEALYCDDVASTECELYAAVVLSTRAHAVINHVDATQALALDGVEAFYSAKDLPAELNRFGIVPGIADEQVFRSDTVTSMGQLIGLVVARDQATAQRAARAVQVKYTDLPSIITLEDAVEKESFFDQVFRYTHGDPDHVIKSSDHVISGHFRTGGQEHFYLETNACIAVPTEDNGIELTASSQGLTLAQREIARVLGVPACRVVCKTKRLGGGFGGKESRSTWLTTAVAFAASRCRRAVRIMLDRDEDMVAMGGRHPFLARYCAAVCPRGRLMAVKMQLFANAGHSVDLSLGVMSRAMSHCDNAYNFPAYSITGRLCRTNTPSNTAFRGFGGPQACVMAEAMMAQISEQMGLCPLQVRSINLYRNGDFTLTRQQLIGCTQERCWRECLRQADYDRQRHEVNQFNSRHRWKKRGIAVLPNKYGICFGLHLLNQGGALVHVYTDGSVLVTTGGVEMGQGLHTKCCQIVTRVLGVDLDKVYINETSTDKVPNSSPTAASMSTDLYGAAVQAACETLWTRLEPFRTANPSGSFAEWASAAYISKISLSACGFHASPNINFDQKSGLGNMYNYHVYGAACALVEIDCLTGQHEVLSTDIVMDIGKSVNPAIDIGQIEGAFIQGYGLFCMERLKYSASGYNHTRGPGTYKIPAFGDIPRRLHVTLLTRDHQPARAVYSSKAVGEPPLFSGAAVLFAIRDAVLAARLHHHQAAKQPLILEAPVTPDHVRLACRDWLTDRLPPAPAKGTFTPWMVDL